MGLTKAENSHGLSIETDQPRPSYSPGDLIRGRVVLHTADDSAIGRIAVSFWGRTKSRIIQQHGQAVTYHRGRTLLFQQEKVLYEGQYTHKPGSFNWPFDFVVPEHADPTTILGGEKWRPKDHYTSTQEDPLDLTLPASNFHRRYMFGRQADCFVEYVLEATMTEPDGLHHIRNPQTKTCTHPVIFHPLSTPEPIQNYNMDSNQRPITISTLKLLPEHTGTSLGLRDRARSIFQRDSIPRVSFSVLVQAPGTIQLFHPKPIPFLITVTPDLTAGATTIDCSPTLPDLVLRSAKIDLKAYVRCRAGGTFADTKTYEIPILSAKQLNQPLKFVHGATTRAEATLDLGALCNLRLGNARLGSRLEAPLTPNFASYNVSRTYILNWELELECAEKTEKLSSVRNGPECAILLPSAITAQMDPGTTLGSDLVPASSATSTGSSSGFTFWSRRRSGEGRAEGEKEKARFTANVTPIAAGSGLQPIYAAKGQKPPVKTKTQEAAEDRIGNEPIPFAAEFDDASADGDSDTNVRARRPSSRSVGAHTTSTVAVHNGDADPDSDVPLPRYVP